MAQKKTKAVAAKAVTAKTADKRPLWKSKRFFVGLLMIAAGIMEGAFDGWQHGMDKMLAGLTIIAGRDALRKLER